MVAIRRADRLETMMVVIFFFLVIFTLAFLDYLIESEQSKRLEEDRIGRGSASKRVEKLRKYPHKKKGIAYI